MVRGQWAGGGGRGARVAESGKSGGSKRLDARRSEAGRGRARQGEAARAGGGPVGLTTVCASGNVLLVTSPCPPTHPGPPAPEADGR